MIFRLFRESPLYTSHLSRFANIFSRSRQFEDKCIAGLIFTTGQPLTIPNVFKNSISIAIIQLL